MGFSRTFSSLTSAYLSHYPRITKFLEFYKKCAINKQNNSINNQKYLLESP